MFVLRALPWMVMVNLWWIVPTVLGNLSPEGVGIAAQTRVEDWSWSHRQNSIPNIVSLTANWGWRYPEFMPWAWEFIACPGPCCVGSCPSSQSWPRSWCGRGNGDGQQSRSSPSVPRSW